MAAVYNLLDTLKQLPMVRIVTYNIFRFLLLTGSLLWIYPAHASLEGSDDPGFESAVMVWLEDNDDDSLPELSALANNGNLAARILLSRIELTDRAPTPFVRSQSRGALLDLFRSPKTDRPFRTTWMKREATRKNRFAQHMLSATSYGVNLDAIRQLLDIGEPQAAEHLIRKVAVDGDRLARDTVLSMIDPMSELVPYIRGFRDASSGTTTAHTALQHMLASVQRVESSALELDSDRDTRHAMQFVDIGYQANDKIIQYNSKNKHYKSITEWIMSAEVSKPVARLCSQQCLFEHVAACANTAFGLIGGYYEVIRFDSPLETVISQSDFLNSERALGMVLRRISAVRTDSHQKIFSDDELAKQSQCLAAAVSSVR